MLAHLGLLIDIAIGVGIALVAVRTAFLGVAVTFRPPQTEREKLWRKVEFILWAFVIAILTSIQIFRSERVQDAVFQGFSGLHEEIGKVSQGRAIIQLSETSLVHPLEPGQDLIVNVYAENRGTSVARDVRTWGLVRLIPKPTTPEEGRRNESGDVIFNSVEREADAHPRVDEGDDLGLGSGVLVSPEAGVLKPDVLEVLKRGDAFIFVGVLVRYDDGHESEECVYYAMPNPGVWHLCSKHNYVH